MYKKAFYQGIITFCLFSFGIFLFFSPSISLAQNSTAGKGIVQIKVEKGLLSVKLKDAPIPQVLREIARQTGIQLDGWERLREQ